MVFGFIYRFGAAAIFAAVAFVPAGFASPATDIPLATYRAVHDVTLDPNVDAPDLSTMTGRVVTEFKGSPCTGYTTTTRFVTDSVDGDDERQLIDSRALTVEKPDGSLDFDNQTLENGRTTEASKGIATRSNSTVHVKLTKPVKKSLDLARTVVFPTEQVTRSIEAAKAGEKFLAFDTYDGLDDGQSISPATVVIGEGSTDPSDVGDEAPIADAGFATMLHWPVTISYFDQDNGGDGAPNYSLSGLLYENGIMRRLHFDYGHFALIGKLVQLDLLPATPCP